ncbi:predicted protein [Postia placenta Mad-698-R]|uniref:Uncharacterized protein n=1 Tax=Postia placenta MAD-698-R-SB12 TaxID=670580 RepID=A0A1X6N3U7_9APHY|nr:hypothetical protein POSPLADRAFT_1140153 [Postia placenta MAD-698-R-SB12]EED85833.1 predicted protein [Postia placenta Mad-698-R]OSX63200.1 hypothetical protein POSPLADRAFT_1140153 [Postia placenta MAD-698-R-SB12]
MHRVQGPSHSRKEERQSPGILMFRDEPKAYWAAFVSVMLGYGSPFAHKSSLPMKVRGAGPYLREIKDDMDPVMERIEHRTTAVQEQPSAWMIGDHWHLVHGNHRGAA